MNQAIQFIDRLEFREPSHQLVFFAQVTGMLVECIIDLRKLGLQDESHERSILINTDLITKNVPSNL